MHISRVELENIKNYETIEYDFEQGVTAISGPNGAGKTTIIEAIAYALFDHLPYRKEDFLRRGAQKGNVRVTFVSVVDGREYTVYRDTANAYYIYDPITKMRLVEQKNQVAGWIREHLGVDAGTDLKTLFVSTIGVPQGTFTVSFAEQPAKRKLEFDKVLRVDDYQRASEQVRSVIKTLEIKDGELRQEMARLNGEIAKLDGLMAECLRQEKAARQLQSDIIETEGQQVKVRAELTHLDLLKQRLEVINSESASLTVRIQELQKSHSKLQEDVEHSKGASAAISAAAEGYALYNQATCLLNELEPQIRKRDELRNQLQKKEQEIVKIETLLQLKREDLNQLAAAREEAERLKPLVQEQIQLEKRLAELQKRRTEFALLSQKAQKDEQDLQSLRDEYQELQRSVQEAESVKELAEQLPHLEKAREECETSLRRAQVAVERLLLKRQEIVRFKDNLAKLSAEIKTLEVELLNLHLIEEKAKTLPQYENEECRLREAVTELRLKMQRQDQIISGIKDGLCPLLSQRCLNIGPGQGLDNYFKAQMGNEQQQLSQIESERAENTRKLSEARSASEALSGLMAQNVHLQRRKQEYVLERKNAVKLQKELEDLGSMEAQVQVISEEYAHLQEGFQQAQAAWAKYAGIEHLRSRLLKLKTEGQERRDALAQLHKELEKKIVIENELLAVEERLAGLADPKSCHLALEKELKKEADLLAAIADLVKKEQRIQVLKEGLAQEFEEFSTLDEQLFSWREQRGASAKDYRIYVENQSAAAMLEAREAALKEVEVELHLSIAKLREYKEIINEISQEYKEQTHLQLKANLEELIGRLATLSSELNLSQKRIVELRSEISQLMEARDQLQDLMRQKERAEQLLSVTNFMRDLLKKAGPFITEAHLQSISMEANQLYRDVTGNPMVTLRWDVGYEIMIEEMGHERPFTSLSGGEKMSAALSVRLALLKELSDIRVAFFDEPTANMDEERRRNLAEQIGRIKDFNQLFVISHDDTFEGFTDRVITVPGAEMPDKNASV